MIVDDTWVLAFLRLEGISEDLDGISDEGAGGLAGGVSTLSALALGATVATGTSFCRPLTVS